MANSQATTATARLFVALDLPGDLAAALAGWGARHLSDPALRPVPPENLHVTLCFLGQTPEPRIGPIVEKLAAIDPEPVGIRFLPSPAARPPSRPSLYAVEAVSATAVRLQARLARDLGGLGVYEPEKRPFWPHVTVARVRKLPGGKGRPQRVEKPPGDLPEALTEPFGAVRVRLYRSTMRSDGPTYAPLTNQDLPPLP